MFPGLTKSSWTQPTFASRGDGKDTFRILVISAVLHRRLPQHVPFGEHVTGYC